MKVNFNEEKNIWHKGYERVVGLDEAGRGPLAGPVVASAVMVRQFKISNLKFKINDSKKISAKNREKIYEILINHPDIRWGIGIVSEKVIDKINILEATKLAMQKAIINLQNNFSLSYNGRRKEGKSLNVDFLLIDGNFSLQAEVPQKSIIKGDQKVFSICAAGIIAKVTRDKVMEKMHKKYPNYGFHKHKGYGTSLHIKNLQKFGPCKIHRKSFFPVSALAKSEFI